LTAVPAVLGVDAALMWFSLMLRLPSVVAAPPRNSRGAVTPTIV
jgi:hypothetical protein